MEAADHLLSHTLLRGLHCPILRESSFMSPWDLEEPCKDPLLSPAPGFPHSSRALETVERKTRRQAKKTCQPSFPRAGLGGWLRTAAPLSPATDSPVHAGAACSPQLSRPLCFCRFPAPRKAVKGTETATEAGPCGASWAWPRRVRPELALLLPRLESRDPASLPQDLDTHVVLSFPPRENLLQSVFSSA